MFSSLVQAPDLDLWIGGTPQKLLEPTITFALSFRIFESKAVRILHHSDGRPYQLYELRFEPSVF